MKKLLVLLLCIFLFGGCSSVKNKPSLPDLNFIGEITVTYKKYSMECDIDNSADNGCIISVRKPELLSGLTLAVKDGVCELEMGEVSYTVEPPEIKDTQFAVLLAESLIEIVNTTTYTQLENGLWKYTGQTKFGRFTLLQDDKTGYPVSLRIPDAELYVKFKNMKSNVD